MFYDDYPNDTNFDDEGFYMTDASDNLGMEETVTISKQYLKDLVQEIRVDYDEEFVPVDSIKSLALRTLYYIAND